MQDQAMAKYLTNGPEARALLAESDTKDVIRYGMVCYAMIWCQANDGEVKEKWKEKCGTLLGYDEMQEIRMTEESWIRKVIEGEWGIGHCSKDPNHFLLSVLPPK